jgi:hypothetical protein
LLGGCEFVAGIQDLALTDGGNEGTVPVPADGGNDSSLAAGGSDSSLADSPGTDTSSSDDSSSRQDSPGDGRAMDARVEAGPTPDGGDAGVNPCGAPTDAGFCTSLCPQPLYCQDFDKHTFLPGLFDSVTMTAGSLAVNAMASVSPPNSLLAQDNAMASGPLDTTGRKTFTALPASATITLDFQFQPAAADTTATGVLVFASLDFTDAPMNRYTVQFTLAQIGSPNMLGVRFEEQAGYVDGGSYYNSHTISDPVTIGGWTHIVLTVNRTGPTAAKATVSFGGTTEIDNIPLAMSINATALQLTVGSPYESVPSTGWKSRYDNVILDIK